MSGFIIFQDGRAFVKRNSEFDTVVAYIAEALKAIPEGQELAQWLLKQRAMILGPGMGRIDLRELTPGNQRLFVQGCRQAFKQACKHAEDHAKSEQRALEKGKLNSSASMAWLIEAFAMMLLMIEAVEKGEPPMALNPYLRELVKPTGKKRGPGWKNEAA